VDEVGQVNSRIGCLKANSAYLYASDCSGLVTYQITRPQILDDNSLHNYIFNSCAFFVSISVNELKSKLTVSCPHLTALMCNISSTVKNAVFLDVTPCDSCKN
jgi:hypothetical protein